MMRILAAAMLLTAVLAGVGCDGSGTNQTQTGAIDVTGTWDAIVLDNGELAFLTLYQSGNSVSGTYFGILDVNGSLVGNVLNLTMVQGSNVFEFSMTVSDNGCNFSGQITHQGNPYLSMRGAKRSPTGQGISLDGTWVSQDMETSVSRTMTVGQNGNILTGTVQSPPLTVSGTINGPMVTFSLTTATNVIEWSGFVSADGDTVTGYWEVEGTFDRHGWLMTRQ